MVFGTDAARWPHRVGEPDRPSPGLGYCPTSKPFELCCPNGVEFSAISPCAGHRGVFTPSLFVATFRADTRHIRCSGCAGSTSWTCSRGLVTWCCRMGCRRSIHAPVSHGPGTGCSRPRGHTWTGSRVSAGVITCTSRWCSERFTQLWVGPASRSRRVATRCGIRLPHTCAKPTTAPAEFSSSNILSRSSI